MNSAQTPERQKRLNFDPSEREREEKSRKLTNEETKMFILFHTSQPTTSDDYPSKRFEKQHQFVLNNNNNNQFEAF